VHDEDWGVSGDFGIQELFRAAAERLGMEFDIPVLAFSPEIATPDESASRLLVALRKDRLL
jgi:hypothetical protein